ncbi:Ig-like domain-containing protein [Rahnella bruchi]|uniref:Ig-like domain-containing protein n=1 Tax=Rahnella bruchi TaxID=1510573 RepID=UPI000EA23207|nr:Ig-like domain-containing protein [Rahnella bruchi]
MSQYKITTNEANRSPEVFNLKAVTSAEDIIAVPAIETGYYLIEDGEGNQLTEGLSLSRHNDALHIHIDESSAPSAIIPEYYRSPALLTVPGNGAVLQALDMAQVQPDHAPVALSLLADSPIIPWAPGIIIPEGATDDSIPDQPAEISNHGGTSDLTPELHGTAIHAEGYVLNIYANTTLLGTAQVDNNGEWSFTPPEGALSYGSNYTFQVLLQDAASGVVMIAMPFTLSETADGHASDDLPNTGEDHVVVIDHLDDDFGIHQGDVANNGVTDDLNTVIQGTLFNGQGLVLEIFANTMSLGTAKVDLSGHWSFDLSGLEDHAQYTIQALLVDSASGSTFISLPFVFTTGFDENPPTITTVTDDVGTVKGDLADGQPTNDTMPTIKGNAEAGAIVNVYDGSTLLGSALTDENGNWTFTPETPLSGEGTHLISATTTDGTSESIHSGDFDLNLDTVIEKPAITGVLDTVGLTQGNVENGGLTDDSKPLLSGTAEAGSTVYVKSIGQNGFKTTIGSVTADENGHWEFKPTSRLPGVYVVGPRELYVVSEDAAGNARGSDHYKITITNSDKDDVTPPDVATNQQLTDDVGPVTGPIANGDITDDTMPTYSGNAEPNAVVIISDNGAVIGSTTVDASGQWSFTPAKALADGDHSFSTVVKDSNGNASPASDPINFTIDSAVPTVTIDSVVDDVEPVTGNIDNSGHTNDTQPTLNGTANADSVVVIYDNGVQIGSVMSDANGAWSFTPETALTEAEHDFTATVIRPASGESDPSPVWVIIVDTTAPAPIDITAPDNLLVTDDVGPVTGPVAQNGTTDDSEPTFSGKNQPAGDTVTVYSDGEVLGSALVDADGNWSFTPDTAMADGQHDITLILTDAAGKTSAPSAGFDFTIDTATPPPIDITAPDNLLVTDDVGPVMGPVAQNGTTDDNEPTFSGKNQPAGDTVTVYSDGEVLGSALVDADGNWSFTPDTAMADGQHDITLILTNAAGNSSAPSAGFDFTIDTATPPPIDITVPDNLLVTDDVGPVMGPVAQNGTTDDNEPTFSGKNQPAGDTVTVYSDGAVLGSALVDADGNWSFTPTEAMADGLHDITLTLTNVAGNTSAQSAGFDFTIAADVPDAATAIDVIDDEGDQQGKVVPGGATDDTTPTIEGDATPGDIVIVRDNGDVIGSTTVDPDGHWNFTPDVPLDNGAHSIDTVVVNPDTGATSEPSDPIDFAVVSTGSDNFEGIELGHDADGNSYVTSALETGVARTLDSGMTITVLKEGSTSASSENEIGTKGTFLFAPKSFGNVDMELAANSETRFDFNGETNAVSFDTAAVLGSGGAAHYFDADGKELGSVDILVLGKTGVGNISFEAPEGTFISYMTIDVGPENGGGTIRLDNFSWGETQVAPATENVAAQAVHPDVALMAMATAAHPAQADTHHATANTHDAAQGHLTLSLDDVISQGANSVLIDDGKTQFAITGEAGEHVDLTGVSDSSLAHTGDVTSAGVTYDVYSVQGSNAELLVQHGLELHTMS